MKIKISRIKKFVNKGKFLTKIPIILAQHPLSVCLFLFLFSLILGGVLLYKCINLTKKIEAEIFPKNYLLKENIYKEVSKIWQEQQTKFNEADFKEYPDPFRKSSPTPGEKLTE